MLVVGALCAAIAGCEAAAPEPESVRGPASRDFVPPVYQERDSAGVTIVEHASTSPEPVAWVPAGEPRVEIGAVEGEHWETLFQVAHATWLPNGWIAITEGGSNRVLVYDSTGAFRLSVGGTGDGPEEFRSVNWVGAGPGDSVFVVDQRFPGSISVYDASFGYARRMAVPGPKGERQIRGTFHDGSWLISGGPSFVASLDLDPPTDSRWGYLGLLRANHSGESSAVPRALPYLLDHPGGRLFYGPAAAAAPMADRIIYTRGDLRQVEVYTPEGVLERIGRIDSPPRPTTTDMLEAFELPSDPIILRRIGDYRIAEVMPWYNTASRAQALLAGDAEIWIQQYAHPPDSADVWDVFDGSARFQGVVRLPAGFRVFQVERGRVLGLWKDALGVEHVQVLELMRP